MKLTQLLLITGLATAIMSCSTEDPKCPETTEASANSEEVEKEEPAEYPEKIGVLAEDGLSVAAHWYESPDPKGTIVLCHQARFNKFEYTGVAERLNELGWNCLAIDQRSGGPIGDQPNETVLNALEQEKGTDFLDAIPDIHAAVKFAADQNGAPVVLWGSSYSSTLVLYEALSNDKVTAVVSFSPGDYFADTLGSLQEKMAGFEKPMFITCAKNEIEWTQPIMANMELSDNQIFFEPEGAGHHGSRALWPHQDGGEEYWNAVEAFLAKL